MNSMPEAPTETFGIKLYRRASGIARPIADFALNRRLEAGKEDIDRIAERRGFASRGRPEGELIWVHGASVGESLSVLPLVEQLKSQHPSAHILVTTGTVTSAKLMEERLPERAFHQYVPLDHPEFVGRFLDHWRPDMTIFVESEFWPNLIIEARNRSRFMALVNGRISPKTYEDWGRQPKSIKYILSSFDVIIAQDYQNAERLMSLSGRSVEMFGNLKNAAAPLPANDSDLNDLKRQIAERPFWLAASTHPGEEEKIVAAHEILKKEHPSLLTIIAPRHPVRGDEAVEIAREMGASVAQRSKNDPISDEIDIYIADTLGELGLFYRLSDIAFVGGGLTPKGGHNPLEPARVGAAIVHGPHIFNFVETYRQMRHAGGAALVRNERELATAVRRLFADEKTRSVMAKAAKTAAEENAQQVLQDICDCLQEHAPKHLNGE